MSIVTKADLVVKEIISLLKHGKRPIESIDDYSNLNELSNTNIYFDKLKQDLSNPDNYRFVIDENQKNQNIEKLYSEINRIHRQRKFIKKTAIYSSVAASVFFAVFFLSKELSVPEMENLALVGHTPECPTLILADGNSVNLMENKGVIDKTLKIDNTGNMLEYSDKVASDSVIYNKLITYNKQVYPIKLSDGSTITLNANSTLEFPVSFSETKREVKLSGEAYFEIAKSEVPFCVEVNGVSVRVLGTKFNVNSTRESQVYTTLVEGSVAVKFMDIDCKISPNQMSIINKQNRRNIIYDVNVAQVLSWMNNEFYFDNQSLAIVLNDIEKWYGVEFQSSCDLNEYVVSVRISRSRELEDIFKYLEKAFNMKFIKHNNSAYEIIL